MKTTLAQHSQPFLDDLELWLKNLKEISFAEIAPQPEKAAVVSVDVLKGFCYSGPLSSPRVAGIVEPIVELFKGAWAHGIRHILLSQDTHEPDAIEFGAWQRTACAALKGGTVDAFKQLPFYDQMVVFEKIRSRAAKNLGCRPGYLIIRK